MKSGLFVPGICAILGNQGSGKSFAALKLACAYANQIEFDLCFNFQVDFYRLYQYCIYEGYLWLAHRIYHNKCSFRSVEDDIESFCCYPKTIYILDEAGVYLNSRNYKDVSSEFLHSLAQVRHDGVILWYIAQYYEMVDKILRALTSSFVHVDSGLRFNKKLGNSEIIWQRIYLFSQRNYRIYLEKVCYKYSGPKHWINARRLADFHWEGVLSDSDKLLFDCYSSFGSRVGQFTGSQFFFKRDYKRVNRYKLLNSGLDGSVPSYLPLDDPKFLSI